MKTLFTTVALSLCIGHPIKADVLSDVWGIATDPFKINAGSQNALELVREARDALIALENLQKSTDKDIRFYLDDLDSKIDRIGSTTGVLIDQAASEVREIEQKIVTDFRALLRETECTVLRTSDEAIRQSLRDTLPSFLLGDVRTIRLPFGTQTVYKLWLIPWGEEPKTYSIDLSSNPTGWEIFKEIEAAYIENLNVSTDQDDAVLIYATWGNLARLAKVTACFHLGDQFEQSLIRKHAAYNAMVYPWNYAVDAEE